VRPEVEGIQWAALHAQGPAMAQVLEAVGNAAQHGVTLRALRALPNGDHWNVSLEAFAANADPLAARQAADRFLRALADAPQFAEPLRAPTRRVVPAAGVEIAAAYRVRK
jgi:hypothetical protein